MLRSLTAKQFAGWQHYAELEPFDETRQDWRTASIVTALVNVNSTKKYEMKDFLLSFDDTTHLQKKKQTWAEQEAILKVVAAGFRAEKGQP